VTVAGCKECHTPGFSGGTKFQLAPNVVSANISPEPTTGIGRWREQDFVDRFAQYHDHVANSSPQAAHRL
jgi:hypothetical protein